MKPLALRDVGAVQPKLSRWRARWLRAGLTSSHTPVDPGRSYLRFTAQTSGGTWEGWVDADLWLQRSVPQLCILLPPALHRAAAVVLFQGAPQPLDLTGSGLACHAVAKVEALAGSALSNGPMPCLTLPHGPLWLPRLPGPPRRSAGMPPWLRQLGLPLLLVLGRRALPARLLQRLGPGDLVVLDQPTWETCWGHRRFGTFTLVAQGFSLIAPAPAGPFNAEELHPMDQPENLETDLAEHTLAVDVEFVLHSRRLSLAELAEMGPGEVLPLPPETCRNVRLMVGSTLIGRGELVQLQGCLGVELHSLGEAITDE